MFSLLSYDVSDWVQVVCVVSLCHPSLVNVGWHDGWGGDIETNEKELLFLINSLLSNPDNDNHYMQYASDKNPASHEGL